MISTNIGLPPGVAERITAIVGQKRMAIFIREAVLRALEEAEAHPTEQPMAEHVPEKAVRSRAKPRSGPKDP